MQTAFLGAICNKVRLIAFDMTEELFALYVKALDRLPERCREVFIRIREEHQSYAQVAEELGISTKTVDAQLQKAVSRLKEMIASSQIESY